MIHEVKFKTLMTQYKNVDMTEGLQGKGNIQ